MGQARYRGPVDTVEQAVWAGRVLSITCQRCGHSVTRWAWTLYNAHRHTGELALDAPVPGFWCKGCRAKVAVVLRAEGPW